MSKKVSLPGVDALFAKRPEPAAEVAEAEAVGEEEEVPANPDTSIPAEDLKPRKFTFYFEPSTLEALDDAWFALRRRLGSRVSKSAIVDHVVRDAVKDLERLEELLSAS